MFTKSLWNSFSSTLNFPSLTTDISVDIAIIGGGITGITTALLLKKAGLKVAVFEAREVGKGTTGHSTGNLYFITDQLLSPIASKYDEEVLKKVVRSRQEAFQLIKNLVQEYDIDCDYKVQDMYIYEDDKTSKIEKELRTANDAGIPFTEMTSSGDHTFPFDSKRGMVLQGQATFNPLLYVQELARQAQGDNCSIYENTKVDKIEEGENECLLNTPSGKIVAKFVVHATHTPKGIEIQYHTVLGPYREYGVAVQLESSSVYPDGIFWGHYNNQKYSIRSYSRNGQNFLLCIGQPHKVGQAEDNEQHIKDLISFLEKRFSVREVVYKWGGQHYKPADYLPYIGRKSDNSNQLIATGFSTDGLIYGTLSAIILSDLISDKENSSSDLFKASRHQPLKAAEEFVKENVDVAIEFTKDRFNIEDVEIKDIKPGEARIIEMKGQKAAVYRDNGGKLSVNSALCTHMGCIVHWNNAETTWDCPCHGSRFDLSGEVIEGPALRALQKINIDNK